MDPNTDSAQRLRRPHIPLASSDRCSKRKLELPPLVNRYTGPPTIECCPYSDQRQSASRPFAGNAHNGYNINRKKTQISQGVPPHCPAGGGDPSLTCWGGSLHPYSSIARPCFVQPGVKPLWGCAFDHALKQGISSSTVCHEYNAEVLSIRYS